MRRLMLGLVLAVAGGVALWAQTPTSVTQMQLVASPRFLGRLQYLAAQYAVTVKAEALNTACHNQRTLLANDVIGNSASVVPAMAVIIAGTNVAGGVIVGTVTTVDGQVDSSASDSAITTALTAQWNALAKCDTGS